MRRARGRASLPLFRAVAAGDVDAARTLLRQPGVDVDAYDADGATLTFIAAAHGHTTMVEMLADEGGADIGKATPDDAKDAPNGGACPLWIAATNGRMDTVRALVQRGADVNQTKVNGDTLLIGAVLGGDNADVVKLIIEKGGDVNQATNDGFTPVFMASHNGHTAALKLLMENGGDVKQATNDGTTPVYAASYGGHTNVLKLLIENGGDVNQATNNGFTPVYIASEKGHTAALKLLIENGGNVNQANKDGLTPVYIASEEGRTAALKVLLKHGADVHKADNEGTLPVWIAAQNDHADALHTLLKAGANARTAQWSGFPTLHIAAKQGHLPVVRVLAEIWPLDRRPWKMFLRGGGAASELQDYLAPPANRTTRNFLPRLYSKPDMVKEIWKYLHKPQYVDPGQLDEAGETAERVATANGKHDVAALLQGLGVDAGVDVAAGGGSSDYESDSE
jgi:ankyrin repeat protein